MESNIGLGCLLRLIMESNIGLGFFFLKTDYGIEHRFRLLIKTDYGIEHRFRLFIKTDCGSKCEFCSLNLLRYYDSHSAYVKCMPRHCHF